MALTILNVLNDKAGVTNFGQSISEGSAILISHLMSSVSYPGSFTPNLHRRLASTLSLVVNALSNRGSIVASGCRTRHIIVLEEISCVILVVVDTKDRIWVDILRF